jgi:hypothetical protein
MARAGMSIGFVFRQKPDKFLFCFFSQHGEKIGDRVSKVQMFLSEKTINISTS